jgi:hypothetical protein
MYGPLVGLMHKGDSAPAWKRMIAGSLCGVMGALSCNPFELVKTRLQSASIKNPIGHQHKYAGVYSALKQIYAEDGLKGLYRGAFLSMARSVVGSGSNLASYSLIKVSLSDKRNIASTH